MTERPEGLTLSNPKSDRIRRVRALTGRSARQRTGRFLIEGPQSVREAVRFGPVDELIITDDAAQRHPEITATATARQIRVLRATFEVATAISTDAQGVIAIGRQVNPLLADAVSAPKLVAVLHEIRDPGNAGTIIRTADAAGADAVILGPGSVDVYNPKVVRATAGSLFHLPVITGSDLPSVLDDLRALGCMVVAADGRGEYDLDELLDEVEPSADLDNTRPNLGRATAWVFGNEASGLPEATRELADHTVRVPIHGRAESLNLATAAAVCLYASARTQRAHRIE